MLFEIDKQTLNDLAIFKNEHSPTSVFNLFNTTLTIGGKTKLEQIFNNPLISHEDLNERVEALKYLQAFPVKLDIDKQTCDFIEFYLRQTSKSNTFFKTVSLYKRLVYAFNSNNAYYVVRQGVDSTLKMITVLNQFFNRNDTERLPIKLKNIHSTIRQVLDGDLGTVASLANKPKLSTLEAARADHLFRNVCIEKIKALLEIVYELDVFTSVAHTGKNLGFNLPVIVKANGPVFTITDIFHPFVADPVYNTVKLDNNNNVCFVTGTNMAGKSTLLKTIGICVYLSQLGFPVPAASMQTSTFNGLITTINLSDDISKGYSHFYNEVLRVKKVAHKLNESNNLFVIFDELFRGTNVKDAYDASLSIISAFLKVHTSIFIISTHITEVAKALNQVENIDFKYMETTFDNETPQHSYLLKNGISDERIGLWIVKNEQIVELIEKARGRS
jgi:DNA mismatch repair protein MutS